MKKSLLFSVVLLSVLGFSLPVLAELPCEEGEDAALTQFPTLDAFHAIMAEMWHKHLPAGDYAAIRQKAPALRESMKTFMAADVPAAFAGNSSDFNAKRTALNAAVEKFGQVAVGKDNAALKTALTDVHSRFHDVVTATQGPKMTLKELHNLLFILMHDGYANRDFSVLKNFIHEFKDQAEELVEQGVTPRPGACPKMIMQETNEFSAAVQELFYEVGNDNEEAAWRALDKVHRHFMALAKIAE